jgi:ectoine hydroxylase-related dioxygenase (phytanoyl-CoA dioxygenase family)
MVTVTEEMVEAYQRDGVVLVKGLWADWVEMLRAGVARNMANPTHQMATLKPGEPGYFFDDYCNWTKVPEFGAVIRQSAVAEVAAKLMRSDQGADVPRSCAGEGTRHDEADALAHRRAVLLRRGQADGVASGRPSIRCGRRPCAAWRGRISGRRTCCRRAGCRRRISIRERTTTWPSRTPRPRGWPIREWEMEPGDAVAFNFRTLHGARGNTTANRRRAFSLRLVGEDARYVERPGPTSPPFPGHGMVAGQHLREDWFPVLR